MPLQDLFDATWQTHWVERDGVRLHTRIASPATPKLSLAASSAAKAQTPLLLLHGHPQSMAMWHRVAPLLSPTQPVVLMDLRGYGDSARPVADAEHLNHSKREMALDAIAVMRHHRFERFDVLAHDRGARVAHRLALDHPQAVQRLMLLDIAPTLAMYSQTHEAFARAYWHWFFLIQAAPLPELLLEANPAQYVRSVMGSRHAGLAAFAPEALAEYERCMAQAGSATSVCEDYRASASIDLVHDRLDQAEGRRLSQPLRVLWGAHGAVGRCFDVLALWRDCALNVSGQALPCGHYLAEELSAQVAQEARTFFEA